MSTDIFKRTTFIVADATKAAQFYQDVFGWKVWYNNTLEADHRFPPSGAPDKAKVHLIVLEVADPKIGKLGLLSYGNPPFDTGVTTARTKVRMGETILVINSQDVMAVYERAKKTAATIVSEPVDWKVPGPGGSPDIHLKTLAMFDPNGIYMEVSQHC